MKTDWDYTNLASSYLKRPDYAKSALSSIFKIIGKERCKKACDVGAGVAHLTIPMSKNFNFINAIEPNNAMRSIGIKRTLHLKNIAWGEGTGEKTKMLNNQFDVVTFGSSFNVCNQDLALTEVRRILKDNGWFVCMWNHRDLNDPIQREIETIINKNLPTFNYGNRREDQTDFLKNKGLFQDIIRVQGDTIHTQLLEDIIIAWKSHASLQRQAGKKFEKIIDQIFSFLSELNIQKIKIPYTTKVWLGQIKLR